MDRSQMDDFLAQVHIARIATADPETNSPHVVPVWYEWDGESLWISSFAATRKVRQIERNPRVSIVIDIAEPGGEENHGVLLEGAAELVREPRAQVYGRSTTIYTRYLGPEGVQKPDPQSWIHDDDNLLIRLKPDRVRVW